MLVLPLDGRPLVVTGTDTEIGKTLVGCALARALTDAGRAVVAVKPVESGCEGDEPGPGEDGVLLARATGQVSPDAAMLRLREPLAPPVAAEREGVNLHLPDWLPWLSALTEASSAELLLVEGAGGLRSPLTWQHDALDLARLLNARALVVAADVLGVLNHILLTTSALAGAGVPVVGVVFSAPADPDQATGGNAATLRRVAPELPIASLPRVSGFEEAATLLAPQLQILPRA